MRFQHACTTGSPENVDLPDRKEKSQESLFGGKRQPVSNEMALSCLWENGYRLILDR